MSSINKDHIEVIRERKQKARVHTTYQLLGLDLAQILNDDSHKSLYMKLAKQYDNQDLLSLAKSVADRKTVRNKGAYFMKVLQSVNNKSNEDTNSKK